MLYFNKMPDGVNPFRNGAENLVREGLIEALQGVKTVFQFNLFKNYLTDIQRHIEKSAKKNVWGVAVKEKGVIFAAANEGNEGLKRGEVCGRTLK